MKSKRRVSRIAGILILAGMIAGVLSVVPSVEGTDYLKEVFPDRNQVYIGAVFQFLLVPIYIGFALVLLRLNYRIFESNIWKVVHAFQY